MSRFPPCGGVSLHCSLDVSSSLRRELEIFARGLTLLTWMCLILCCLLHRGNSPWWNKYNCLSICVVICQRILWILCVHICLVLSGRELCLFVLFMTIWLLASHLCGLHRMFNIILARTCNVWQRYSDRLPYPHGSQITFSTCMNTNIVLCCMEYLLTSKQKYMSLLAS